MQLSSPTSEGVASPEATAGLRSQAWGAPRRLAKPATPPTTAPATRPSACRPSARRVSRLANLPADPALLRRLHQARQLRKRQRQLAPTRQVASGNRSPPTRARQNGHCAYLVSAARGLLISAGKYTRQWQWPDSGQPGLARYQKSRLELLKALLAGFSRVPSSGLPYHMLLYAHASNAGEKAGSSPSSSS